MKTIEPADVLGLLGDTECRSIEAFDTFAEIDSTSTWLMRQSPPAPDCCRIALAGRQTAGRGRRDRPWLSPDGAGLWLSLARTFRELPGQLPAVTLAIGAGLADCLADLGADVRLKWPNDLMSGGAKLGGILTELQSRGRARNTVVVGVGINVDLPAATRETLERERGTAVCDLKSCVATLPAREALAAAVIRSLLASIERFETRGFAADLDAWRRYDWLAGRRVSAEKNGRRIAGTAGGVDVDGALLLHAGGSIERIVSGSVELLAPAKHQP